MCNSWVSGLYSYSLPLTTENFYLGILCVWLFPLYIWHTLKASVPSTAGSLYGLKHSSETASLLRSWIRWNAVNGRWQQSLQHNQYFTTGLPQTIYRSFQMGMSQGAQCRCYYTPQQLLWNLKHMQGGKTSMRVEIKTFYGPGGR